MKVVIDARMYNQSGIGRYLRNLISELQELDKKNEYFILHLKDDYDTLVYHSKNFHKVLCDFRWYTIEEQIKLPGILKRINPDLVHFPHFNVPIFYKGKFVVTIHDLIHQHYSMMRASLHDPLTHRIKQVGYRQVFKKGINESIKIFTPTEYVKNQLVDEWQVDESRTVVTPEGIDNKLVTAASSLSQTSSQKILEKFKINGPYILYVGSAHPHKNVGSLIATFLPLRRKYDEMKLVLSGQDNDFWKKIRDKQSDENIIYTGFVTEEELAVLYKNASVFVTASLEEGFGLPVLEAMALSCPVICSNIGSLKEVAGNAAIYFDPLDTFDMVSKLDEVLNNEKLRKELIEKGKKRAKLFSWKKLAQQTLEVYQQCA